MTGDGKPRVALVGAGPGDPGLLTVRGAELLREADLIFYDQLVPKRLLESVDPAAECLCVRDLAAPSPDRPPQLLERMIEAAKAGRRVVRLKSGDPFVFGRGSEEAIALQQAGVDYEVVPGVTAALAAAAVLDIPLTHRAFAGAVALVTGHELPARPGSKLDWQALARFPGTLAIYMGIARLPLIVAELLRHGKDPATPAAIVERASTGDMRTAFAPLVDIESTRRAAGLEAPGLILVGAVLAERAAPSWYERLPLFGRRVLVTRAAKQAEPTLRQLELLGAVALKLPSVEIQPGDRAELDAALDELNAGAWDWLVFSSANGVHGLLKRHRERGHDFRRWGAVRLAAVGPKTAEALAEYHLTADLVPPRRFGADALLESLRPLAAGRRVLLARADRGRELLAQELARVATVGSVVAYKQVDAVDPKAEEMAALRRGEVAFVLLTSSNIATSLLSAFDDTVRGRVERGELRLVAISGEVARAAEALGYRPAAVAAEATAAGLLAALVALAAATPHPAE